MSAEDDFATAQLRVKQLKQTPATDELLALYALYKQGSSGDVSGSRPGMLDFKGRAKYDAWAGKKGVTRENAQKQYAELVAKLAAKYG